MDKKLIKIAAYYFGVECSYTLLAGRPTEINKSNLNGVHLERMSFAFYRNFKLHLRPLWSITEEELRELGEVLGLKDVDINLNGIDEFWRVLPAKQIFTNINEDYFTVYEDNTFDLGFGKDYTKIINHLRAKGFCVDQELVDAGLVEWK